ncbi:hypothetical protein E5676_scaffold244G00290 [Cucumis melo var. makuwa]|uniref:Uncharacterized protein n=1 Tax=Cucumis melo var. makuwa TaxID=1194695 RepID=A0A5D3DUS7_CUCMM|nr:hypothetical protein E5676_scaffold244G00290 [Cucumis melo var. makuwa]
MLNVLLVMPQILSRASPDPPNSLLLLLPSPDRRPNPLRLLSRRHCRLHLAFSKPLVVPSSFSNDRSRSSLPFLFIQRRPTAARLRFSCGQRLWPKVAIESSPNQTRTPLVVPPHATGSESPPHSNLLLLRSCTAAPVHSLCVCPHCCVLLRSAVCCVKVEPRAADVVFFHGVRGVTLDFRSFTASAVVANSPMLGLIRLDADLNKNLASSQDIESGKSGKQRGNRPSLQTGELDKTISTDYMTEILSLSLYGTVCTQVIFSLSTLSVLRNNDAAVSAGRIPLRQRRWECRTGPTTS